MRVSWLKGQYVSFTSRTSYWPYSIITMAGIHVALIRWATRPMPSSAACWCIRRRYSFDRSIRCGISVWSGAWRRAFDLRSLWRFARFHQHVPHPRVGQPQENSKTRRMFNLEVFLPHEHSMNCSDSGIAGSFDFLFWPSKNLHVARCICRSFFLCMTDRCRSGREYETGNAFLAKTYYSKSACLLPSLPYKSTFGGRFSGMSWH